MTNRTPRFNYVIQYQAPSTVLTHTVMQCSSTQAACRRAIKYWIAAGLLKKQPSTSSDWESSFEGITVLKVF